MLPKSKSLEVWWSLRRKITLLWDPKNDWIKPYVDDLKKKIIDHNRDEVRVVSDPKELKEGDIAFFIGCTFIVAEDKLNLHKRNCIIHESALPYGRGFAPMAWQILEGRREITVSLILASVAVDAGDILLQKVIYLQGTELLPEWRSLQGQVTRDLCWEYLSLEKEPSPVPQQGETTVFPRRTPKDSELDIGLSIEAQFDQLRVVDNNRYPAFFTYQGQRYFLKIEKDFHPQKE